MDGWSSGWVGGEVGVWPKCVCGQSVCMCVWPKCVWMLNGWVVKWVGGQVDGGQVGVLPKCVSMWSKCVANVCVA